MKPEYSDTKPEVGMPCTLVLGSNLRPYEIVRVSKTRKTFDIKPLRYTTQTANAPFVLGSVDELASSKRVIMSKRNRPYVKNGWIAGECSVIVGIAIAHNDYTAVL